MEPPINRLETEAEEIAQSINSASALAGGIQLKDNVTSDMIMEAIETIQADEQVPQYWIDKYEREIVKNWNLFYKRNATNFFKDRMWIHREFTDMDTSLGSGSLDIQDEEHFLDPRVTSRRSFLIEIGCGVGNALIPLLLRYRYLDASGFDCSPRAIELLNQRWASIVEQKDTDSNPCTSHSPCNNHNNSSSFYNNCNTGTLNSSGQLTSTCVFNILIGEIPKHLYPEEGADFALLLFVLSALPPHQFSNVVGRVKRCLRPGGILFFRDYGRYDMTQLRFAKSKRAQVRDNFYVRQDSTLAYYFTTEETLQLFSKEAGLECLENTYVLKEICNRKIQKTMKRIWVQSKFRKPLAPPQ